MQKPKDAVLLGIYISMVYSGLPYSALASPELCSGEFRETCNARDPTKFNIMYLNLSGHYLHNFFSGMCAHRHVNRVHLSFS